MNPIDDNFLFKKKSADKVWQKRTRGWKVPFLVAIRVKVRKRSNSISTHNLILMRVKNFHVYYT